MKRVINSDYQLPDYPEAEILDFDEEIEFHLDADIYIDDSGSWEYDDEDYPWAEQDGKFDEWDIEPYDYPGLNITIADKDQIVEYTDDLLEPMLPFGPGKFHIEGDVTLSFEISDVKMYENNSDEYFDDTEYITDDIEIKFQFDKSRIDNFEIEEID